jgi:hypothetical protein
MMAVEVSTTPVFQHGNPKALFAARILGGGTPTNPTRYDVTLDGEKFMINVPETDAAAFPAGSTTVVLNWQIGLKK